MFQTVDGGIIVSGRTSSVGAGNYDAWLVKVDASGNLQWNKTWGGPQDDRVQDMVITSDGGYALCCLANSFGAGIADFWLIKTDSNGNVHWNKTYGGTGSETPYYITQTSDGGYAMTGNTNSSGAGNTDVWLVKTNTSGDMEWNKTYGGTAADNGLNIIKTSDEGFAIVCTTASFGAGGQDVWLIKTDGAGTMQWNKTYGGSGNDQGMAIVQTADGGYTMAAITSSSGAGANDAWLIKTDSSGNTQWNRTYGGPGADNPYHMLQTPDGGYITSGLTTSSGAGGQDAWLVKWDAAGNVLWSRTYGGTNTDQVWSLALTSDGGFIVAAMTQSLGFGATGAADMLLIKTDADGIAPALPAATAFSNVMVLRGWTWYFVVHSNGGAGARTYQWYENTTLLQGQTSLVLPVTKVATGNYTFYCKVTDAQGLTVSSNTVALTVIG
jgi:predicted secreted protein